MKLFEHKQRNLKIILGILLFIALWITLLSFVLNSEWAKKKIIKEAEQSLEAKLDIETLEFNLWKGEALLTGIQLDKQQENLKLNAEVVSAEIHVNYLPLLWFSVNISDITLNSPNIKVEHIRPVEQEPKETLEKFTELISTLLIYGMLKILMLFVEMLLAILSLFAGPTLPSYQYSISEITVNNAVIEYVGKRENTPDFNAHIKGLNYHATDVDPTSIFSFIKSADYEANIIVGDNNSKLVQNASDRPQELSLTNVDIGYADRMLSQNDLLIVNNGILDIRYTGEGNIGRVKIDIRGLELEKNPEASTSDFMFMKVDWLIDYVDERNGEISIDYELDQDGLDIIFEDDIRLGILVVLKKVWMDALEAFNPETFEDVKEQGVDLFKGFLKKKLEENKVDKEGE